jgi:hypothetical protein
MSDERTFTCPYCNNSTTLGENFYTDISQELLIDEPKGYFDQTFVQIEAITCPNPKCKELVLRLNITTRKPKYNNTPYGVTSKIGYTSKVVKSWELIPEAQIKIFPTYIPKPILEDYAEACSIKKLSPKASATLSRRCLQGIIRDFWGITKGKLSEEINELETEIDKDLWDAIDGVRQVGNIGAHMEKDINVIIDVDQNEAQILIDLIEMLLEEWYIKKHDKEEKLKQLKKIADKKNKAKKKKVKK